MNQEELVANLGTIARSGSKVTAYSTVLTSHITHVLIMSVVIIASSRHRRPFWMPCRTRQRPAVPSSVSSE